ncbi:MAG: hypothetical protein ABW042_06135 [Phenylobacterium sp.]
MKMRCEDLPDAIRAGEIRFQGADFGALNISHIHLPKGADAAPLLAGLPGDLCQCPHWGVVLKGAILVRYADGQAERVQAGEVYHWPAGHTVSVDDDYEAVEFSPAAGMAEVMAHLRGKLGGG